MRRCGFCLEGAVVVGNISDASWSFAAWRHPTCRCWVRDLRRAGRGPLQLRHARRLHPFARAPGALQDLQIRVEWLAGTDCDGEGRRGDEALVRV
jgi:hypothetical protein